MVKIVRSSPYSSPDSSETITGEDKIASLLKRMSKHYSPFTIKIAGHKHEYSSCIVDVETPYILLDELMPNSGHEKLVSERNIFATGKLEGIDIKFETSLVRVDESKNVITYYMKLPEEVSYHQRRQAYRVRIPMSKDLRVLIDTGNDELSIGELKDLSHGGVGKIVPQGESNLELGQLYECVIELPCSEWLYCTVEARFKKEINGKGIHFIGAMFIDLSSIQRRLIARCISDLSREELQRRMT